MILDCVFEVDMLSPLSRQVWEISVDVVNAATGRLVSSPSPLSLELSDANVYEP